MSGKLYTQNPNEEPMFEVDWEKREVTIPESLRQIAVTNENNAETIYIKVPDSFDGITLRDKRPGIRLKNARKEMYFIALTDIDLNEDGYIILGWKIDERLTRWAGEVLFEVHFGDDSYNLHTLPAGLEVLKGLELISESEIPDFEDHLSDFLKRLSEAESRLSEILLELRRLEDKTQLIAKNSEDLKTLAEDINYLKKNVVYLNTYTAII